MKLVRAVLLVVLALSGAMTGVTLAAGVTTPSSTAGTDVGHFQSTSDGNETSGATLGAKISAFMQSNAAEADGTVESGMWIASFAKSRNQSEQAALVDMQTNSLRTRLERIEDRKQDLIDRREAGEISQLKYESEMSALVGQYVSLVDSINETERRAEGSNASAEKLDALREESKRVAGPEVAEAARNLSGTDAPGLEKQNRTNPSSTTGNATRNTTGKGNGANASKKANRPKGNGNASVDPGNGSVATPGSNATLGNVTRNATGNASGVVENATRTVNVGNGNESAVVGNVTRGPADAANASNWSNANASWSMRTTSGANAEPGNDVPGGGNGSVADRNPTTLRSTRVVTTTAIANDTEMAGESTSAATITASTNGTATATNGTVAPTTESTTT